jgi:hypothetical protein
MYQTLGQLRNNWRRAVCPKSPYGNHNPDYEDDAYLRERSVCLHCRRYIRYDLTHWMTPRLVTLVEWP